MLRNLIVGAYVAFFVTRRVSFRVLGYPVLFQNLPLMPENVSFGAVRRSTVPFSIRKSIVFVSAFLLIGVNQTSSANDELEDLRKRLTELDINAPMSAKVSATTFRQNGKGDKKIVDNGNIDIWVDKDIEGISLRYEPKTITLIEQESTDRSRDPEADTPTSTASEMVKIDTLDDVYKPAHTLKLKLGQFDFLGSEPVTDGSEEVVKLKFGYNESVLNNESKKYIKKFKGEFTLWLNESGHPVRSENKLNAKGRVFLFIKFSFSENRSHYYDIVDNRLLLKSSHFEQISSGLSEYYINRLTLNVSYP